MNAKMRNRSDLFDRVIRGMLGLALVAGVVWALAHGGPSPSADIGGLLR